jgi:hypothetical protein
VEEKQPMRKTKDVEGRDKLILTLRLKDLAATSREGSHSVLFFDESINHLEFINKGDKVQLLFTIHAGISKTGQSHTNLIPIKINKL